MLIKVNCVGNSCTDLVMVLLIFFPGVKAERKRVGARDGKTGQRKNLGSTEACVS